MQDTVGFVASVALAGSKQAVSCCLNSSRTNNSISQFVHRRHGYAANRPMRLGCYMPSTRNTQVSRSVVTGRVPSEIELTKRDQSKGGAETPANTVFEETTGGAEGTSSFSASEAERDAWLSSALSACDSKGQNHFHIAELDELVHAAIARINTTGLPGRRDEMWRYTNIRPLLDVRFQARQAVDELNAVLTKHRVNELKDSNAVASIVILNGQLVDEYSELDNLPDNVYIGSLAKAPRHVQNVVVSKLVQRKSRDNLSVFELLNIVASRDICVVHVPDNVEIQGNVQISCLETIHVDETSGVLSSFPSSAVMSAPGIVVIMESGSRLDLIESFTNVNPPTDEKASPVRNFVSSSTVVHIAENAVLNHHLISHFYKDAVHLGTVSADVSRGGVYEATSISMGATISRFDVEINLLEEGCHGAMFGFIMADSSKIGDLHSAINHKVPSCTSEQLQKNVVVSKGRAIFRGQILIDWGAQKSASNQLCRSIILSSNARVDAMPVLIINNCDVTATHGATITDLSDEEIFYLQSRGLSPEQSKLLLLEGFGLEIFRRMQAPSLQKLLVDRLDSIVEDIEIKPNKYRQFSSI